MLPDDARRSDTADAADESARPSALQAERGLPSIRRAAGAAMRVRRVAAVVLMVGLGVAVAVIYAQTLRARALNADGAAAATQQRASVSEMTLPGIGPVELPAAWTAPPGAIPNDGGESSAKAGSAEVGPGTEDSLYKVVRGPDGVARDPVTGEVIPEWALRPAEGPAVGAVAAVPGPAGPATPTPEQLARERQLAAPVLWQTTPVMRADLSGVMDARDVGAVAGTSPATPRPTVATRVSAVPAGLLPTRRWWLPRGSFVDCTLETAIDSTFAGLVTCVTAADVFGADGQVVLLERGSRLIGEAEGSARAGQARVRVLWQEARTPAGVVVPLEAPATDALGRSGVPGRVDRHFGERFGAALLVSVVDGAIEVAVERERATQGGGAFVIEPRGSQDVLTELLRSTMAIPPTIRVAPGSKVQVIVARDVDFRDVYELRAAR